MSIDQFYEAIKTFSIADVISKLNSAFEFSKCQLKRLQTERVAHKCIDSSSSVSIKCEQVERHENSHLSLASANCEFREEAGICSSMCQKNSKLDSNFSPSNYFRIQKSLFENANAHQQSDSYSETTDTETTTTRDYDSFSHENSQHLEANIKVETSIASEHENHRNIISRDFLQRKQMDEFKYTSGGRKSVNELRGSKMHKNERQYECSDCHKKFGILSNLKAHKRIHTGEKPFECLVCNRRFRANGDLKSHMRTHTGERPFVCKYCECNFGTLSALIGHERTHTGEKPYQCYICSKSFRTSSNLTVHLKIHSNKTK